MSSMLLDSIFSWIGEMIKALVDIIPKIMYLLYASLACLIDVIQLAFRKIAGLDVYYVDGQPVTGDLVSNFITGILGIRSDGINYSVLSTVFWSFVLFGIILLFVTTLVAIIKSHYSYDDKAAKGPMQYVYTACKALLNMAVVPIVIILGLFVNQYLLQAVDTITAVDSGEVVQLFKSQSSLLESVKTAKGDDTYIFYDIFGFNGGIRYGTADLDLKTLVNDKRELAKVGSTNQTFSGSLFKVAAYNANRARQGEYTAQAFREGGFTGAPGSGLNLFAAADSGDDAQETEMILADMIDMCFVNNLHLKTGSDGSGAVSLNYSTPWTKDVDSGRFFTMFFTKGFSSFSKFNIGLVWYYYNLWNFNFIVGFGALMVCATIFINIIFGLISRLFMCIVLFLIAPPLFALAPLDNGDAGKKWRTNFMKQVLMTYGAVLGMNIMFLILPLINSIDFFNIPIADVIMQTLMILAGLITIKAVIGMISDLIGAEDANKTGEGLSKEVGAAALSGAKLTTGAAKLAGKIGTSAVGIVGHGVAAAGRGVLAAKNKIQGVKEGRKAKQALDAKEGLNTSDKQDQLIQNMASRANFANLSKADIISQGAALGLDKKQSQEVWNSVKSAQKSGATGAADRAEAMRTDMANRNKHYNNYLNNFSTGSGAGRTMLTGAAKAAQMTAQQNAARASFMAHNALKRGYLKQAERQGRLARGQLGDAILGTRMRDKKTGALLRDKNGKLIRKDNGLAGQGRGVFSFYSNYGRKHVLGAGGVFQAFDDDLSKKEKKAKEKKAEAAETQYRENVLDLLDKMNNKLP